MPVIIRAKWDLYNSCRLNDSVTLTLMPFYALDVNHTIEVILPNKNGDEVLETYIVKNINTSTQVVGTQTVTAMKYYAYYAT